MNEKRRIAAQAPDWTPQEDATLTRLWNAGKTAKQILKELPLRTEPALRKRREILQLKVRRVFGSDIVLRATEPAIEAALKRKPRTRDELAARARVGSQSVSNFIREMREMCMTLDWSPMMSFSPWALVTKQAFSSGNALLQFLQKLTDGKTFADLDIELKVIASDLLTEKEYEFSKTSTPTMPIALAARASASIPIVFAPVPYGEVLCVDGGCADNLPASNLTVDDVPRVGIYLESDDAPLLPGAYGLKTLAPRIIDLLLASNEASHVELDTKNGATIVRVQTGYASSLDRNMPIAIRQRLIDDGYAATKVALTQF